MNKLALKIKFNLTLFALISFAFITCKEKVEICEELVFYDYIVKSDRLLPRRYLTYIINENASLLSQVYFWGNICDSEIIQTGIIPDTSTNNSWYYNRTAPIEKSLINLATLNVFYMPFGHGAIDLNVPTGTIFHTRFFEGREGEIENGAYVFEAKLYDTTFNELLRVRECNKYSFYAHFDNDSHRSKCIFYYDIDRCIFAQIELWNIEAHRLTNIVKVMDFKSRDKSYFDEVLSKATPNDDSVFMPIFIGF